MAVKINDYLASTNCKDFKLLNTQLLNTKALYNSGVLLELDYKKYQKFYEIAKLKQNIDDYISCFSNSHKDKLKLSFALDEIKKSCSNETIIELPSEYIRKLDILMNILNNAIQRSHELDKKY